jgi:hypothetical protein
MRWRHGRPGHRFRACWPEKPVEMAGNWLRAGCGRAGTRPGTGSRQVSGWLQAGPDQSSVTSAVTLTGRCSISFNLEITLPGSGPDPVSDRESATGEVRVSP